MMNRRTVLQLVALLALMLVCGSAFADDCTVLRAGGVFDRVATGFHSGTNTWLSNAEKYALHIFWSLAAIEFAWSAISWVLRKNSVGEYLTSLFFKVMSISFFFFLISNASTWIPLLLQGFQQLATGVSQGSGGTVIPSLAGLDGMISPSAVMGSGVCIVKNIGIMVAHSGDAGLLDKFFFAIIAGFTMIIVGIAFCIIVLQLTLTEIEAFIVLFGGLVMLGFTGSRWTSSWGEKYFGYAVSVGVKLMVIYLVITLGNSVILLQIQNTYNIISSPGGNLSPESFISILLIALVYAGLAWNLPSMAGTFLNGSPNMSMGNMAAPAMAAAGAAVGAAAVGVAAAAGGASLAGKGIGMAKGALGGGSGGGGGGNGPDMNKIMERMGKSPGGNGNSASQPSKGAGGGGNSGNSGGGNSSSGVGGGSLPNTGGGSSDGSGSSSSGSGGSTSGAEGGSFPNTSNDASGSGGNTEKPISIRFDQSRQNAFNDPNANTGSSGNNQQGGNNQPKDKSLLQKAASKSHEFGKNRLDKAAQHLKTGDGSTGGISIRFNHTE